jgi:hypothetical protein
VTLGAISLAEPLACPRLPVAASDRAAGLLVVVWAGVVAWQLG